MHDLYTSSFTSVTPLHLVRPGSGPEDLFFTFHFQHQGQKHKDFDLRFFSVHLHSSYLNFHRYPFTVFRLVNKRQRTEFYACLDYVGNQCQTQNADKIMLSNQFIIEALSTFGHGKFNAKTGAGSTASKHETQGSDIGQVKYVCWAELSQPRN